MKFCKSELVWVIGAVGVGWHLFWHTQVVVSEEKISERRIM